MRYGFSQSRSPGHQVDAGSFAETFDGRSATKWLRLYGRLEAVSILCTASNSSHGSALPWDADKVQSGGLMGVAAKAFDLEIVIPGVEGVASDEKQTRL
jgi:hypothetical protein